MKDATAKGIEIRQSALANDAVEEFLARYRDASYRIALRIVADPDLAQDVAQEALIRAFKSWDRLASVECQAAWVRKIVVRRAVTALSNRTHEPLNDETAGRSEMDGADVRATLDTLEPHQRAILGLALGEGLSYQEIADAMEIPIGTVGSRLHAAKAAFRKQWEAE